MVFYNRIILLVFSKTSLNQIERIEITVRSIVTNIACEETEDVFWKSKSEYFSNSEKY